MPAEGECLSIPECTLPCKSAVTCAYGILCDSRDLRVQSAFHISLGLTELETCFKIGKCSSWALLGHMTHLSLENLEVGDEGS